MSPVSRPTNKSRRATSQAKQGIPARRRPFCATFEYINLGREGGGFDKAHVGIETESWESRSRGAGGGGRRERRSVLNKIWTRLNYRRELKFNRCSNPVEGRTGRVHYWRGSARSTDTIDYYPRARIVSIDLHNPRPTPPLTNPCPQRGIPITAGTHASVGLWAALVWHKNVNSGMFQLWAFVNVSTSEIDRVVRGGGVNS